MVGDDTIERLGANGLHEFTTYYNTFQLDGHAPAISFRHNLLGTPYTPQVIPQVIPQHAWLLFGHRPLQLKFSKCHKYW